MNTTLVFKKKEFPRIERSKSAGGKHFGKQDTTNLASSSQCSPPPAQRAPRRPSHRRSSSLDCSSPGAGGQVGERLGLGREQLGQRGGPDGLVAALCPRSARASALRALSAPRARCALPRASARSAPAQLASGAPRRMYSVCVPALRAFLNTVFRLLGASL